MADSGNARIRIVDTDARVVSTWFTPLDKTAPELVAPASLSVALTAQNGQPMIYLTDSGGVSVIQHPVSSDSNVKVLSHLTVASGTAALHATSILPYGTATVGIGSAMGFTQLIVYETGVAA